VAAGGTAAPAAAPEGTPVRLPSGIEYTVLKAGEGPTPRLGSRVRIHLTGRLLDGQVFMDTRAHGVPREYRLDKLELINGLVDQLLEMKKGERRRIRIPSALAYGAAGYRGQVPGNADLDVDVELVGFGP
jgi:FKBP-type peptidyl-prolyl cis-trans isomerase